MASRSTPICRSPLATRRWNYEGYLDEDVPDSCRAFPWRLQSCEDASFSFDCNAATLSITASKSGAALKIMVLIAA